MPYYEHVFIARQDIGTPQVETLTGELSAVIEAGGGRVAKNEYWGLRPLAYKIKKNRKGHYVLMSIDAPFPALAEMERKARLNEDIIRFMTVRTDSLEEGPSIFVRSKSERGERGDRDRGDRGDRDRGDRGDRGDRDRGDRGGRRERRD